MVFVGLNMEECNDENALLWRPSAAGCHLKFESVVWIWTNVWDHENALLWRPSPAGCHLEIEKWRVNDQSHS